MTPGSPCALSIASRNGMSLRATIFVFLKNFQKKYATATKPISLRVVSQSYNEGER